MHGNLSMEGSPKGGGGYQLMPIRGIRKFQKPKNVENRCKDLEVIGYLNFILLPFRRDRCPITA